MMLPGANSMRRHFDTAFVPSYHSRLWLMILRLERACLESLCQGRARHRARLNGRLGGCLDLDIKTVLLHLAQFFGLMQDGLRNDRL